MYVYISATESEKKNPTTSFGTKKITMLKCISQLTSANDCGDSTEQVLELSSLLFISLFF